MRDETPGEAGTARCGGEHMTNSCRTAGGWGVGAMAVSEDSMAASLPGGRVALTSYDACTGLVCTDRRDGRTGRGKSSYGGTLLRPSPRVSRWPTSRSRWGSYEHPKDHCRRSGSAVVQEQLQRRGGGQCVEAAASQRIVHVRDSKLAPSLALTMDRTAWAAFIGFAACHGNEG
ncbi:DUF397 domain-containing protein [Streptomyces violaceusniger]|uniref:DUF397 domain-containing protein n=1 Tax=Streptomyces violaceusniger TaxID=68280 RepID=UPI003364B622